MSDAFSRQAADRRAKEVRRLLAGAGLVVVLSIAWHGLRPYLVRGLARSSGGYAARERLIAAALRDLYPRFPIADRRYGGYVWSFRGPSSGLVIWQTQPETEALETGQQARPPKYVFVDERLAYIGRVHSANPPLAALPADWDGDGKFEITMNYSPVVELLRTTRTMGPWPTRSLRAWALFRPAPTANEVAGIIVVDLQQWQTRNTLMRPQWRDENGDGRAELAFVASKYGTLPGRRMGVLSQETVAVFEWSAPGGVLVPRQIPDDGSFLVWSPEDGRLHEFSPDTVVEDVCRELLPIPNDFGTPSASQPVSQPASEPSTQPALP